MRRVMLDDLLRAATGLRELPEERWRAQVQAWCHAAHVADAVRKRLGARAAARFGAAHLGGRVRGQVPFSSDRGAHRRLLATLASVEAWRDRM